jgi:hypothetical protein
LLQGSREEAAIKAAGLQLLKRSLFSGTLAAMAVTVVASLATRRLAGSSAAALNATSHFLWGERAARQDAYSLKYTAVGATANHGAAMFWAFFYEMLAARTPRTRPRAFLNGALVSAAAYITDYHVVPRRLTPGFELRLPGAALAGVYAALALGLAARDLVTGGRRKGLQRRPHEHHRVGTDEGPAAGAKRDAGARP